MTKDSCCILHFHRSKLWNRDWPNLIIWQWWNSENDKAQSNVYKYNYHVFLFSNIYNGIKINPYMNTIIMNTC